MIQVHSMATPRVITRTEADAWKKLEQIDAQVKADIIKEGNPDPSTTKDTILTALNKYIPATVIILYTFLDVILNALETKPVLPWLAVFFIMLIGAGWLTYRITKDTIIPDPLPDSVRNNEAAQPLIKNLQSIISTQRIKMAFVAVIAFAGYVLALGGPFVYINGCDGATSCQISFIPFIWQPYWGAVGLVLATLAVAIIIGKDILAE